MFLTIFSFYAVITEPKERENNNDDDGHCSDHFISLLLDLIILAIKKAVKAFRFWSSADHLHQ